MGLVNSIRIFTKRKFSKALARHRKNLVNHYSARAKQDRNMIFKFVSRSAKNSSSPSPADIPEDEWYAHYESEFSAPDPSIEQSYEAALDQFLSSHPDEDFIVSTRSVEDAICRLKWKGSSGIDEVSAIHLKHGGKLLVAHLSLLMQMIFSQGIVPASFCIGDLTPISKKGKSETQCTAFRPITVATSLCKLFELLFIQELEKVCYTPPHQFGFKRGTGCADALTVVANVLIDAESSGESLSLAGHDIRRAFDSLIHAAMLLKAGKRGLNLAVIRSLRNLYSRLRIRLKLPPDKGLTPIPRTRLVPVKKGARQGAVTSPDLFNNCVLDAQDQCPSSLILSSANLSLVCYADDILNLSRTLQRAIDIFEILEAEYLKVGLQFNSSKSEIVLFNWKTDFCVPTIALGSSSVQPVDHLIYLGLPIGSSIRHTRKLLLEQLKRRISASYASVVSCKLRFNRLLLASLYNAIALPHILYATPFWKLLTKTDQNIIRAMYFRFAKYLLRLPPWYRNSHVIENFKVADPDVAVARRIAKHNRKIHRNLHEWSHLLIQ